MYALDGVFRATVAQCPAVTVGDLSVPVPVVAEPVVSGLPDAAHHILGNMAAPEEQYAQDVNVSSCSSHRAERTNSRLRLDLFSHD